MEQTFTLTRAEIAEAFRKWTAETWHEPFPTDPPTGEELADDFLHFAGLVELG